MQFQSSKFFVLLRVSKNFEYYKFDLYMSWGKNCFAICITKFLEAYVHIYIQYTRFPPAYENNLAPYRVSQFHT